ncbi:hypothetical protein SLEP1_g21983 [Rubroshorea leprosula]|uniref:Uncharacterized protein n=1 Tax=Rubroshorea leprosula TaxID=152421 RepID=A0AAV5JDR4_9ROSI|nr:hypothetical protein SLEP1_g21983 [Rubroshorea leprosula]
MGAVVVIFDEVAKVKSSAMTKIKKKWEEKAEAEVKAELNSRSRGVGGGAGAGEEEQNILEVLDFCPETKMKSRASSSASTLSFRPSVDRSGARQVVCDHGLAAQLHVSTSELNPGISQVVVEQELAFFFNRLMLNYRVVQRVVEVLKWKQWCLKEKMTKSVSVEWTAKKEC